MSGGGLLARVTVVSSDASLARLVAERLRAAGDLDVAIAGSRAAVDGDAAVVVDDGEESGVRPLTAREAEVLELLADGLANKQIAHRLGISDHTVKFHVNAILTKLAVTSRTEAVVQAARRGLVIL